MPKNMLLWQSAIWDVVTVFEIFVSSWFTGIPEDLPKYYYLFLLQKIILEELVKGDHIKICTRNCASMPSLLCMQRKTVTFKFYLGLKKREDNLEHFLVEKWQNIINGFVIYFSLFHVSFWEIHLKNNSTQSGQSCVPLTSSIIWSAFPWSIPLR